MRLRRILASLVVVAVAGGAAYLGTSAFFSDTETSTGNVLAAGGIDLQIDNVQHYNGMACADSGNGYEWRPVGGWELDSANHPVTIDFDVQAYNEDFPAQYPQAGVSCDGSWRLANLDDNTISGRFFNFTDIKPGDSGENTVSLHVVDNDAWMCAAVGNIGPNPAEANDTAFRNNMSFFAWWDDGNNIFDAGEIAITDGPLSASALTEGVLPIADSQTGNGPIEGLDTEYIGVAWCAGEMTVDENTISCDGEGMGNDAQGGHMTADIQFYAVQSRNNANFTCADGFDPVFPTPSPTPIPNGELVGAALGGYTVPGLSCDITVNDGESIQAAIDNSEITSGETVCVGDGTFNSEEDSFPLRVNKDGLTLAAVNGPSASTFLDGGVIIDNDDVTVTGFNIGSSTLLDETFGVYVNTGVDNAIVSYNNMVGPGTGVVSRGIITATGTVTGAHFMHNIITNYATGIYMNPSKNMTAEYNTLFGNNVGSSNDGPVNNILRYNVIKNNLAEGVGVSDAGTGGTYSLVANFNNIYGNPSGNQMNNYDLGTDDDGFNVDAEDNWWGDDTPADNINAGAGAGFAPIDFEPFKSSAFDENV